MQKVWEGAFVADVMLNILTHCDIKTLVKMRAVSSFIRNLTQHISLWRHRLPPGSASIMAPKDRCDMALCHSSVLLNPDVTLDPVPRNLLCVPNLPAWLPDPLGNRRRILGIVNGKFEHFEPGDTVRMYPVYLTRRSGVVVVFVKEEDAGSEESGEVEEIVFHDLLNNETICLDVSSLPYDCVWSIPGTNLVLNGCQVGCEGLRIQLLQWDEHRRSFVKLDDGTTLFKDARLAFSCMPKVVANSWGVVLTGRSPNDCATFLSYRLNSDGGGLTFCNGCTWDYGEFFESYTSAEEGMGTSIPDWDCVLGTSVMTFAFDCGNYFAADILEKEENATPWTHYEKMESHTMPTTCGGRVIAIHVDSVDSTVEHYLTATRGTHTQKVLSGLDKIFSFRSLPLHPARMIEYGDAFGGSEEIRVFDPLRGRITRYELPESWYGLVDCEHFTVVFEDDVGGPLVARWEERVAIVPISRRRKVAAVESD